MIFYRKILKIHRKKFQNWLRKYDWLEMNLFYQKLVTQLLKIKNMIYLVILLDLVKLSL
jgi:hypothetical protein